MTTLEDRLTAIENASEAGIRPIETEWRWLIAALRAEREKRVEERANGKRTVYTWEERTRMARAEIEAEDAKGQSP